MEKGLSYVDTILEYCEENIIDVEEIADLISKNLKEKIAMELRKSRGTMLENEFDGV